MGISTYVIREGSKVREDRIKLEMLAQEIFTVNIFSTIFAYLCFIIVLNWVPKFSDYKSILIILSFALPLSTLGTEWIFSIYEDYAYITIRSILFQFISLILMFVFVKEPDDVNKYAIITVVSNAGANIFNYKYANKYFKHKIVFSKKLCRHIPPIMILFASAIASQIYVNSDTTMLGFFKDDYAVGLYAASTKVYNIIRSILSAFITVLTPRLTYYFSKREYDGKYDKLLEDSLNGYSAIIIPAGIGIACVSDYIINILSGKEYIVASPSLKILAIALIFSTLGSFIANEILIVSGQETRILFATSMGAVINFVGNLWAIPLIGYIGAAFTTLISEIIVFIIQLYYAKSYLNIRKFIIPFLKIIVACLPMGIISYVVYLKSNAYFLNLLVIIVGSISSYIILLILMKHELVKMTMKYFMKRKDIK